MKSLIIQFLEFIALVLIGVGLLYGVNKAHASEFKSYQFVDLQKLAENGDKYNGQEIQTKGRVIRIDKYEGRYGGQYYGIVLAHGITVFSYEDNLKEGVSPDDVIIVDGTFYTFFMYGGSGHDFFIATHHLEKME